jgi:uncharacterized membrane protein YvlD (DUF360 family)
MANLKNTKRKLQSKIEAVKKINDRPQESFDDVSDKYLNNVPDINSIVGKKIDALNGKINKKKENTKDIFSDMIDITSQFMGSDKNSKNNLKQTNNSPNQKIKQHAITAMDTTIGSAKEIVVKNLSEALFMGNGICGTESVFDVDLLTLKPDEFDFLDALTIDPDSSCGKIIYEPKTPDINKQKVNRNLYDAFGGTPYTFTSNNGKDLFTAAWDTGNQRYNISGLTQGVTGVTKVQEFISDYYSSMEFPDINHIIKTSMLLTIQGGSQCGDSRKFNVSLDKVMRLIKKLLAICGSPNDPTQLKNQNPVGMFNESDEDAEFYFDFDDVEGIDLDDEDARYRRVLRFKDCYNFEIPVDTNHIEDFIYLTKNKNAKLVVDDILNKVALDATQQSDSGLSLNDFLNNLLNNFILNLPKALMITILSGKLFLPLVILYKIFKAGLSSLNIKELVKKFYKSISKTVKELFWLFVREFWKLIKSDLLAFVSKLVQIIIKNKYKRYLTIITSLIAILKKILEENIDNCFSLFQTILSTLTTALSMKVPMTVPSVLLLLSEGLPGYSQDRAFMNIMERLEASGVPTGPLYGESNDIGNLVKSVIDGHTEESDTNGFVKTTNSLPIITGNAGGPIIIPPGILNIVGKNF